MPDEIADPEKFFAIKLHLAAVRSEDFDGVRNALARVRDQYSRGGSSIGVENVRPGTVVNR